MADDDTTTKLWPFAYATYVMPGVSDACLDLQDRFGADVNLLLFAAWAGRRGTLLQPQDVDAAHDLVSAWHDDIVKPLRAVRRRLKSGSRPAPTAETEVLRAKLKALEIEAERVELAQLETILPALGLPALGGAGETASDLQMLIQDNVRIMLTGTGMIGTAADEPIRVLSMAATTAAVGRDAAKAITEDNS